MLNLLLSGTDSASRGLSPALILSARVVYGDHQVLLLRRPRRWVTRVSMLLLLLLLLCGRTSVPGHPVWRGVHALRLKRNL